MRTQSKQHQNIGCGDGPHRWIFEEFLFSDGVWGRPVVRYECQVKCEKDDFGRLTHAVSISNAVVVECCADDAEENEDEMNKRDSLVLQAFGGIQCRVEEHELFLRGVSG